MHVFIDFWKLETENSLLHVFSFLHKLSFENSFCFLPVLSCQTSFLVSKIENCFWKQKTRGKNSYQTCPNISIHFPPPKASHNLSSKKKKKNCNQSISQPKIIRAPPSPLQVGKISNPTILARVSGEFSCASSTPLWANYVRWGHWGSPFTFTSTPGQNS